MKKFFNGCMFFEFTKKHDLRRNSIRPPRASRVNFSFAKITILGKIKVLVRITLVALATSWHALT
jgi:hypothetical protein